MQITLTLRSLVLILFKIVVVFLLFIFDSILGMPLVSCFFLMWFAPDSKQPAWPTVYLLVNALLFSSLLMIPWWATLLFFTGIFLLIQVLRTKLKRSKLILIWLSVILSSVLFILAQGKMSLAVFSYWAVSLVVIVLISRQRWFTNLQSQTWYIR